MVHPEVVLGFLEALCESASAESPPSAVLPWVYRPERCFRENLSFPSLEAADVEPDVTVRQIVPAFDNPEHLDIGNYGN